MTRVWAIGDLHLSFGVPNKNMDVFGKQWTRHAEQIASAWKAMIHQDDLVLIPGDISWAMRLEEVIPDLNWIDALPGTKVLIKGNHDFWWSSLKKVASILPPSMHLIQNNAFHWKGIGIAGARLWDTPEYGFHEYIDFQENVVTRSRDPEEIVQEDLEDKIFNRELDRLKISLQALREDVQVRIAMTHYPPIGASLQPSRAAQLLEQYGIQACVFGHLHNVKPNIALFGEKNNVRYILAAADYIRFQPIPVL